MFPGCTYTLTDHDGRSAGYFQRVRRLADGLLERFPDTVELRRTVRAASSGERVWKRLLRKAQPLPILSELEDALGPFLADVDGYLRSLPLSHRFDRTLGTRRKHYLLFMLEVELTNRINADAFRRSAWRMALIAHCLRDFRKVCRAVAGEVEARCAGCDGQCLVPLGSVLMRRYGIEPYISVSMDHRRLLKGLGERHPDMGVLGIACLPELVAGLRLCEDLGIPAVGVPLNANRCSRWTGGECLETTFSLEELERLSGPGPGPGGLESRMTDQGTGSRTPAAGNQGPGTRNQEQGTRNFFSFSCP